MQVGDSTCLLKTSSASRRRPPQQPYLDPTFAPQRGPAHPARPRRPSGSLLVDERRSPRFQAAEALEKAALAELHARRPDRVLATNVEFWSAVILDLAEVPPDLFTPMFTCARVAGWSAHVLEQKREAKLILPTAKYVGHGPRGVSAVE
jgi:hypothetical protein